MTAKEIAEKAAALGGWELFGGGSIRREAGHSPQFWLECPVTAYCNGVYPGRFMLPVSAFSDEAIALVGGEERLREIVRAADNLEGHDPELRRILLTGVTK